MPQMFYQIPHQNVPQPLINLSSPLVLNLHDFLGFENISVLKNEQALQNEGLIFLSLSHLQNLVGDVLSNGILRLLHFVVWTLSSISTPVSSRNFVINTTTPYSLLISTFSINTLIKYSPKHTSFIFVNDFIYFIYLIC